jgi:YidC/Oxa1 family membrane protein insertase
MSESILARHMSTTIGEGADKIDFMTDVAEVLADKTLEAVTSQVPAISEVALAAADSWPPVAALQYFIDGVHNFTGLNWWASIVITTFVIRGLTVPLMINQLKATTKLTLMRPRLEEVKQEMDDRGMSPSAVTEGQAKMAQIFKEYGVTPWTPLKGILIQGPVFVSFFLAIQNMVEKVPSFKTGGFLWFTDLTTPDAFYILPVVTALTFLITVECNMQEGLEGNPAAGTMKKVSRVFAVLTVPFTMTFPKAIFCYWVTSNIFSLFYGLVIKRPGVKKYFNVPILPEAPPSKDFKPAFTFMEAMKKYVAAQQRQQIQPPQSPELESKTAPQRISTSSILSHRIKMLEKGVKSKKKNKKR